MNAIAMLWQWWIWHHWNSKHVKKNIFVLLYTTKITYNNAQTFFVHFQLWFIHSNLIVSYMVLGYVLYALSPCTFWCVYWAKIGKRTMHFIICVVHTQYQKYETTIFFENFILPLHTPNYEKIQKKPDFRSMCEPS